MTKTTMSFRVVGWIAVGEAVCILALVAMLLFQGGGADSPKHGALESAVEPQAQLGPSRDEVEPTPDPVAKDAGANAAERIEVESPEARADTLLVHGQVRDEQGTPVSDTFVVLENESGLRCTPKTQNEGHYAVAGLPPGSWSLRITATGYLPFTEQVEFAPSSSPIRHDIDLATSLMIVVRVVFPDGRSIMDVAPDDLGFRSGRGNIAAIVSAQPVGKLPLSNLRSSYRSASGEFRNRLYQDGQYIDPPKGAIGFLEAHVPPPFHVTAIIRQTPLARTKVTEPVDEVTLVVTKAQLRASLARVTIRVVDAATGEPLTNGHLALNDRQTGSRGPKPDQDGIVVLDHIVPGLLVLEPMFQEYEHSRQYVRVEPGSDLDLGTLALHKTVQIQGTVLLHDGTPADASITYRCLDRMTFPQPLDVGIASRTDETGSFTINVGRGRYLLVFSSKEHSLTSRIVDTSSGSIENFAVKLEAGVPVTINREASRGFPLLWQVINEQSVPLVSGIGMSSYPIKTRLVPGPYTIRVYEDDVLLHSEQFTVGSSPLEITVKL